uniref:Uncharacterized protein n=1 Tax=Photinus pyralis TaxID=7054 RepID=A0A1Y1MPJ8_PHOPY
MNAILHGALYPPVVLQHLAEYWPMYDESNDSCTLMDFLTLKIWPQYLVHLQFCVPLLVAPCISLSRSSRKTCDEVSLENEVPCIFELSHDNHERSIRLCFRFHKFDYKVSFMIFNIRGLQ